MKLHPTGNTLEVLSFFTPMNFDVLETYDIDLGSQGLLLVPGTNWAISGGKEGKVYVVNRDTMGGVDVATDHVIQEFSMGTNNQLHGGAVYWHSEADDYIYIWPSNQHLRAYRINYNTQQLDQPEAMQSAVSASNGQPGGMLSISSNGNAAGSGILWATLPLSGDANQQTRPGILRAYDATDLSHELWNSQLNLANDSIGGFAKFVCPTIANGKVYVPTFSGKFLVYGLLNTIGINNVINDKISWTIYPNPTQEQVTLTGVMEHEKEVWVEITDITGRLWVNSMVTINNHQLQASIDVTAFPAGIYIMKVNGTQKLFVKQ
ncbi:MAG: T9SS type A sorting domain-containing protein [Chitinophagales bacterium]